MAGVDDVSVGEEKVVESDDGAEVESSVVSFDRLGFVGGVHGGYEESRAKCPGPHLLYMALYEEGPPIRFRLGAIDQNAIQGLTRSLDRVGWRSNYQKKYVLPRYWAWDTYVN